MPKTQAALLEAMAEHQVTVDGVTRALPDPFLVMATENPIEQEGTFPLPEAQLDRFFLKTELGYPSVDEEIGIVREQRASHPLDNLKPVASLDEVRGLEGAVEDVYTDELLLRWIVELVTVTRELDEVALGASVRASLALERTARAWALLDGRDYVTPEDVELLFTPVVAHRVVFTPAFVADNRLGGRDAALQRFRELVFERVPRPEPTEERELKVLSGRRADVTGTAAAPVPLYPRRRLLGAASGGATSIRRGGRADVASSRPYQPGDHLRTIDWKAPAPLLGIRARSVHRARAIQRGDAGRRDRRRPPPRDGALSPDFHGCTSTSALHEVARVLVASALNHRSLLAYLDFATHRGSPSR